MSQGKVTPSLSGSVHVPGDKSITHRAIMFGTLANGVSRVITDSLGRDNMATIRIFGQLGGRVEGSLPEALMPIAKEESLSQFRVSSDGVAHLEVHGLGLNGLRAPSTPLDCGNSGTTARLLSGVLAAQEFSSTLVGDESLSKRPFRRVTAPLSMMGAKFSGELLPLTISGARSISPGVKGIRYHSEHASAQVKSAILLAGLYSAEEVVVSEPRLSRDHTERMFRAMGCALETGEADGLPYVKLPARGRRELAAAEIRIPRDFSAAAFFLVAGSVFPGSDIVIPGVGINKTRLGLLHVLRRMGADIRFENEHDMCGEPVADIRVRAAELRGVEVSEEDVVLGVDEIPVLSVAAALAHGNTRITGAAELRVKESDRLKTSAAILKSAGVPVEELPDGLVISGSPGGKGLYAPASTESWRKSGDHRIAMSGAILDLFLTGKAELQDRAAVETSFPGFEESLYALLRHP